MEEGRRVSENGDLKGRPCRVTALGATAANGSMARTPAISIGRNIAEHYRYGQVGIRPGIVENQPIQSIEKTS